MNDVDDIKSGERLFGAALGNSASVSLDEAYKAGVQRGMDHFRTRCRLEMLAEIWVARGPDWHPLAQRLMHFCQAMMSDYDTLEAEATNLAKSASWASAALPEVVMAIRGAPDGG